MWCSGRKVTAGPKWCAGAPDCAGGPTAGVVLPRAAAVVRRPGVVLWAQGDRGPQVVRRRARLCGRADRRCRAAAGGRRGGRVSQTTRVPLRQTPATSGTPGR
ncbi:hypothetical protein GCM10010451_44090 [Streptomyces virens]|uniref:Uncharacterized protein n=1 Tax=Streptomyces virens TaxID=285572 RepID=A0ABP6PTU6_9ACTN